MFFLHQPIERESAFRDAEGAFLLFSNLELLTVVRDARDDVLFVRVRSDVAVDDLILFPHVHRENVLHCHILQQILDAEALAAFTKARSSGSHAP